MNVRLKKQTKKSVTDFISDNLESKDDILLGIFLKKDDIFIGTIRIGNISYFNYFCTVGICLFNKKFWKQGYALEAMNKCTEFIFETLGLHYIEAGVYADNSSSKKLFERAGFSVSTVFKDKYRYEDKFQEVIMMAKKNSLFEYSLLKGIKGINN